MKLYNIKLYIKNDNLLKFEDGLYNFNLPICDNYFNKKIIKIKNNKIIYYNLTELNYKIKFGSNYLIKFLNDINLIIKLYNIKLYDIKYKIINEE